MSDATPPPAGAPQPRPWSMAAAMEPVAPNAPPPAAPIGATVEVPLARMPAEGGKKMNILPVLVISLVIAAVLALATVLILRLR